VRTPLLALAAIASFPLLASAPRSPATPAFATTRITVDARCAGPNNTQVSVAPWNARIAQGDSVEWVVNAAANTEEITITAKRANAWPFTAATPYRGSKAAPARGAGMRNNARGRYSYNIQLVCQSGATPPDTVLIDPDIIVD
jgi:hypothetical protein